MRKLAVPALSVCLCFLPSIAQAANDTDVSDQRAIKVKACGTKDKEISFSVSTDKKNHPIPAPSEGKAMVYVIRPTMMGNKIQTKFAVDGEWKGANRGDNYFFLELEPGEHYFCSQSENRDALKLLLVSGKTYFIQQHIVGGFVKVRNRLEVIPEEKGRGKLTELNLATWEVKN
jgi:hypothetical protein